MRFKLKRVGVIGAGRIGAPVIDFLRASPAFELAGVFRRTIMPARGLPIAGSIVAFLEGKPDLIIELASPQALAAYGVACLEAADVWTVNGAALSDVGLCNALAASAAASSHRLRLHHGAIAGLDGVSAIFQDPDASLTITIQRPALAATPGIVFIGSVRDAARLFPHETNVAVAAAWAGPGLDKTRVTIISASSPDDHRLALEAHGKGGRIACSMDLRPDTMAEHHPVAASVIAALERESRAVWAG